MHIKYQNFNFCSWLISLYSMKVMRTLRINIESKTRSSFRLRIKTVFSISAANLNSNAIIIELAN